MKPGGGARRLRLMNGLLASAAASASLLVPLLFSSAAPVLASCRAPVPIEQAIRDADSVLVGTVASLSNNDRWANVAVEEVWKGPDLPTVVEVRGAPEGMTTSADRMYAARQAYLFVVLISDGALTDNACSATTEFTADLVRFRPETARRPLTAATGPDTAAPFEPTSLLLPAALIVAAGLVVFGGALALRRRA